MLSKLKTIVTTTLAALLIGIAIGWTAHSDNSVMPIPSLRDFKYMHIPDLKVPSFHGTITPQLIFVTDTVQLTKLRRDMIYVPKAMPNYVLSNPANAITTHGSKIDWTSWNPENRTYQVREYRYHPSRWHYDISANVLIFPSQSLTMMGINGKIGNGRFNIGAGAYLGSGLIPSPILTIDYKLISKE
ncbi:MAG TPA: hypothetical protein VKA08_12000 [Balneolales bacterium]|nr:hypothetical protein [Balneolales bacterium]